MKNILIIGGTGTISSPVVQKLYLDEGINLTVLTRGRRSTNFPSSVSVLQGDFNDIETMRDLLDGKQFDSVINFNIFTAEQALNEIKLYQNITKQYIMISTAAVLNHELTCNITEESISGNRFSEYGQNKQKAEEVFLKAFHEHAFPITIVRPSQTYSNERLPLSIKGKTCWTVIQRMIEGKPVIIHGDGQAVWASTHADDFAELFVPLVSNPRCTGEIYQIMNDTPHTWDMIYLELAKQLGVEYKPVYISTSLLQKSVKYDLYSSILGDKHFSNIYDISKAKSFSPDFKFNVSIEEGIRRYLAYMDAHPELKKQDDDFNAWCDELITRYQTSVKEIMNGL